jgi:hypothetical protein
MRTCTPARSRVRVELSNCRTLKNKPGTSSDCSRRLAKAMDDSRGAKGTRLELVTWVDLLYLCGDEAALGGGDHQSIVDFL